MKAEPPDDNDDDERAAASAAPVTPPKPKAHKAAPAKAAPQKPKYHGSVGVAVRHGHGAKAAPATKVGRARKAAAKGLKGGKGPGKWRGGGGKPQSPTRAPQAPDAHPCAWSRPMPSSWGGAAPPPPPLRPTMAPGLKPPAADAASKSEDEEPAQTWRLCSGKPKRPRKRQSEQQQSWPLHRQRARRGRRSGPRSGAACHHVNHVNRFLYASLGV